MVLEKELEAKFKKRVEAHGARVLKFVSPGCAGVPDRIVLIPGGRCVFAEIKRPGEELRPLQWHVVRQLINLGYPVWLIDSERRIEEFCMRFFKRYGDGNA